MARAVLYGILSTWDNRFISRPARSKDPFRFVISMDYVIEDFFSLRMLPDDHIAPRAAVQRSPTVG